MIFDIKLGDNFRRKARLVGGGHTTTATSSIKFSSVVSRESSRISLIIAALNDLDIMAYDIKNAYLTTFCREKVWTFAETQFVEEEGDFDASKDGIIWDKVIRLSIPVQAIRSAEGHWLPFHKRVP